MILCDKKVVIINMRFRAPFTEATVCRKILQMLVLINQFRSK
jgi:hypothetical protein